MPRGRSSGNFSFSRASAIADIEAQQARERSEAKQSAAEAKNQRTEAWNAAADRLKQLAQNVLDGTASAKDYADEIDNVKSQFADKAGLLDTNLRSVIRGADTTRFNDYVSGATSFDDFKSYTDERVKGGSGDQEHLKQLLSKAQKNEDTVQYNSYVKGETSINDWNKYVNGRSSEKSAGNDATNVVSIHLATLDAQAQANEARANDKRYQTAYQAGVLPGDEYQKYLDTRISGATNPNDLNALRIEKQTVVKNEFVKGVNEIIDQHQSGRISAGEAALQLHAMLGKTNDATLQGQLLNHISSLQKESAAGAASVAAALRQKQTVVNENYAAATAEFNGAMTKVNNQATKGNDPATVMRMASEAWSKYALDIESAAKNSTDPDRANFFQTRLTNLDRERSASLSQTLQDAAQAKGELTGKNTNPIAGAGARAEILMRGLQNSEITNADKGGLYNQAKTVLSDASKQWSESQDGRNTNAFISNRAYDVMQAGAESAQKALQQQAASLGITIDFKDRNSVEDALRGLILADPTAVWKTFHDNNVPGYGGVNGTPSDEFKNVDTFTREWDAVSGGALGLADVNKTIFTNKGSNGLSLDQRASLEVYGPKSLDIPSTLMGSYQSEEFKTKQQKAIAEAEASTRVRDEGIAAAKDFRAAPIEGSPEATAEEMRNPKTVDQPPKYNALEHVPVENAMTKEGIDAAQNFKAAPIEGSPEATAETMKQTNPADDLQFQTSQQETATTGPQELIQEPITPQATPIVPIRDLTSPDQIDPGAITTQADLPDQDPPSEGVGGGGGRGRE